MKNESLKADLELAGQIATLKLSGHTRTKIAKILKVHPNTVLRISTRYLAQAPGKRNLNDKALILGRKAKRDGTWSNSWVNPEATHGTLAAYNYHFCRCAPCRDNKNAIATSNRDKRALRALEEAEHGTVNAYVNWCCRCGPCLTVGRKHMRDALFTPPETQTRSGELWVDPEVDAITSYDKPARELALDLGRSTGGVYGARSNRKITKRGNKED